MENRRAQILAQEISTRLDVGAAIGEELYRRLFEVLSDMAVEGVGDDGAFALLLHDVRAAYRYDGASKLEGFDVGACWAAMSLMDACGTHIERESNWRECVAEARGHRSLFEALEKMPGANQRELAEELGCGASNVSQRLARLEPYRLFVSSVEGKSKRYYLTPKGKRALEEVRVSDVSSSPDMETVQLQAALFKSRATGNATIFRFEQGPEFHIPTSNAATGEEVGRRAAFRSSGNKALGWASIPDASFSNSFSGRYPAYV